MSFSEQLLRFAPQMWLFATFLFGGLLVQLVLINCGRKGLIALAALFLMSGAAGATVLQQASDIQQRQFQRSIMGAAYWMAERGITYVNARPSGCAMAKTEAALHGNFVPCINAIFAQAHIDANFSTMQESELGMLSTLYLGAGGSIPVLARIAAQHLSAANLTRFASAFGNAETDVAVNLYAPHGIAQAYFHANRAHPAMMSVQGYRALGVPLPPAQPTLDMSLTEIYYEFRTALEGYSAMEALYLTVEFGAKQLAKPLVYGITVGKSIDFVLDKVSPGTTEAIGAIGGQFLQNVTEMDVGGFDGNPFINDPGCGCSITVETWNMMDVQP